MEFLRPVSEIRRFNFKGVGMDSGDISFDLYCFWRNFKLKSYENLSIEQIF